MSESLLMAGSRRTSLGCYNSFSPLRIIFNFFSPWDAWYASIRLPDIFIGIPNSSIEELVRNSSVRLDIRDNGVYPICFRTLINFVCVMKELFVPNKNSQNSSKYPCRSTCAWFLVTNIVIIPVPSCFYVFARYYSVNLGPVAAARKLISLVGGWDAQCLLKTSKIKVSFLKPKTLEGTYLQGKSLNSASLSFELAATMGMPTPYKQGFQS